MKKEKLYKIEKNEQEMIDAFKSAVTQCLDSGKYGRYLNFEEVHTKEGYCIIAVIDYGKFTAKIKYNPCYLFCDFLDVKFSLGGKYDYSIYDIFNLFDIKDFNQYYYSSIEIKENLIKYVEEILDMINKYSFDIEKACEPQNIITLDSNVENDYKNTFPKDNEETWREDVNDPLALDIIHPYFTSVSSATDSAKLFKEMSKKNRKGKLTTIYEHRLLEHLEQGNSIVNKNVVESKKQEKSYAKTSIIIDVCIALFVAVAVAVYYFITKYAAFSGAYVPRSITTLGPVTLPFSPEDLVTFFIAVVLMAFGLRTLLSKTIIKKVTHNDPNVMQRFSKDEKDNGVTNKFSRVIKNIIAVIAVIFGITIATILNDNIGFYDDYVKFDDYSSFSKIELSYEDVKIAHITGEYDEDDNYVEYTDVESYALYDNENHYYILEYLSPEGETATRIDNIIKEYNKEVTEYDSVRDFEETINPIEE
ncbi:MAG: hypothetical protein ACI4IR_00840 [Eubacterium sp.]